MSRHIYKLEQKILFIVIKWRGSLNMYIKWLENNGENTVFLNKDSFQGDIPKSLMINIGGCKKEVGVAFDNNLSKDTIGLSTKFEDDLTIPDTLPYEVYIDNGNLYIGPVIAFVAASHEYKLTAERINNITDYFMGYQDIKGLIFVCSGDRINRKYRAIEGYYYNPNGYDYKSRWQHGFFPYPDALFKKAKLDEKIYEHLYSNIGNKIFNSINALSKWKLWKLLSSNKSIKKHLPHTNKLKSFNSLEKMLNLYESVYLKPRNLSRGRGIIKVSKTKKEYLFIDRFNNKTRIKNKNRAVKYVNKLIKRKYIVQQAVPFKYNNRNVDFRVYMQKNCNMEWDCTGIVAKVGKKKSIVTNFHFRKYLLTGEETFKKLYGLNDKKRRKKELEIIKLCISACKIVEKNVGHLGDVAVDLIVDKNLKVWLLEIQVNYSVRRSASEFPPQLYRKIVTHPFEYGKFLGGFKRDKKLNNMS